MNFESIEQHTTTVYQVESQIIRTSKTGNVYKQWHHVGWTELPNADSEYIERVYSKGDWHHVEYTNGDKERYLMTHGVQKQVHTPFKWEEQGVSPEVLEEAKEQSPCPKFDKAMEEFEDLFVKPDPILTTDEHLLLDFNNYLEDIHMQLTSDKTDAEKYHVIAEMASYINEPVYHATVKNLMLLPIRKARKCLRLTQRHIADSIIKNNLGCDHTEDERLEIFNLIKEQHNTISGYKDIVRQQLACILKGGK